MIKWDTFSQFAGSAGLRPALSQPWIEGLNGIGDIMISDGRVLLCAAVAEIESAGTFQRGDIPDPPETEDLWDLFSRIDPEVPAMLSDEIEIRLEQVDCPECEGDGSIKCDCPRCEVEEHDCENCDGTGDVYRCSPSVVEIYGRRFDSRLVLNLVDLPDVRFYEYVATGSSPDRVGDPVLFRFGTTGQGILQPLVPQSTTNKVSES